jgi:PadR family transcriptional regulator, regulatory protein PadR
MIYNIGMAFKSELEALVLGALRDGPLHGYRIALAIRAMSEGALKMGDNQIYPTLHRLESDGLVSSEWEMQTGKPSRKTYSLTVQGRKRLKERQKEWEQYASNFSAVIGLKEAPHGA